MAALPAGELMGDQVVKLIQTAVAAWSRQILTTDEVVIGEIAQDEEEERYLVDLAARPVGYWLLVEVWLEDGRVTTINNLGTSLLWQRFVIVRLALVYRGRALPLGWVVRASGSATVPVASCQRMLAEIAELIPAGSRAVLLADRGFIDVKLMQLARKLNWRFRIRVKVSVFFYQATQRRRTCCMMSYVNCLPTRRLCRPQVGATIR
jgi:hypothetical protein